MRTRRVISLCCLCGLAGCWTFLLNGASWRTIIEAVAEPGAGEEEGVGVVSPEDQTNNQRIPHVDVTFAETPPSVVVRGPRKTGFKIRARMQEGTGYRVVIADIQSGFSAVHRAKLLSSLSKEIRDRVDQEFSADGVLVSAPQLISEESGGAYGGTAVYESLVTAEYPGYYTIVVALVRPFSVRDKPKFAVVRAELE